MEQTQQPNQKILIEHLVIFMKEQGVKAFHYGDLRVEFWREPGLIETVLEQPQSIPLTDEQILFHSAE